MTIRTGIVRLTSPYMNDINDAAPGTSVAGYSGQPNQYAGMVGSIVELDAGEALKHSDTVTGTLYGGVYQYVKLYGTLTATPAVGIPVYWQDFDNHVVTTDHITSNGSFAGVMIGVPTAGNYCFILIQGKVNALPIGSLTTTGAAGGALSIKAGTDGGFDYNSAALTGANLHLTVGQWIAAPASALALAYVGGQNFISAGFFA